jgi:hypothetical protein
MAAPEASLRLCTDASGGEKLIEALTALSLLYVDSPDHKVRGHLEKFCAKIRPSLAAALVANRPEWIVEKFHSDGQDA